MKKKISVLMATLFALTAVCVPVGAEGTQELSKSYKTKYKQILETAEKDEYISGVYIGDLTGDEREDLLVAHNEFGLFTLYVPTGKNKLKTYDFSVVSMWGFTKYIKADRALLCMNYYGHTMGSPYSLSMEKFSITDDKPEKYTIKREYDDNGDLHSYIDGQECEPDEYAISLHNMIAETARTEYIPLVKYNEESLSFYEGEIIDTDYQTYISEKLG